MELVVVENFFCLKSEPIKYVKKSKWFFSVDLKTTNAVTVTTRTV